MTECAAYAVAGAVAGGVITNNQPNRPPEGDFGVSPKHQANALGAIFGGLLAGSSCFAYYSYTGALDELLDSSWVW
jgi:hypothetical protein